jgi:hypothetical protein
MSSSLTQNEALQQALALSRKSAASNPFTSTSSSSSSLSSSSSSSSSSASSLSQNTITQPSSLPGFASSGAGQGLAMPSGLATLPGPAGTGTTITLGASPAQAAGLIGPGGLVSLLAAVNPTRILVLLNAVGDDELASLTELADVCADIGAEAQTVCQTHGGHLLRIVCPRPHAGETIEGYSKTLARPDTLQQVGATGLLMDGGKSSTNSGDTHQTNESTIGGGGGVVASFPTAAAEFFKQTGGSWSESVAGVVEKHQSAIVGIKGSGGGGSTSTLLLTSGSSSSATAASTTSASSSSTWAESVALSTSNQVKSSSGVKGDVNENALRKRTRALGKVFLEFDSSAAAIAVQRELAGMFYSGKIVVSSFADEVAFTKGEICDLTAPDSFVLEADGGGGVD